jgi:thymidine phosphorylase
VLSKKVAAGASHVLIDMPVGPTAKVRSDGAAQALAARLTDTASAMGLTLAVLRTDGRQPVGVGIGPALEARDVLSVLRGAPEAPADLRTRALAVAGALLDLAPGTPPGQGLALATQTLDSGRAWAKFLAICEAQGGFSEPGEAPFQAPVLATHAGRIRAIDNRRLAKVAKLAGAPGAALAGLVCSLRLGDPVVAGQPLYTVHAQSPGERDYALAYAHAHPDILSLEAP